MAILLAASVQLLRNARRWQMAQRHMVRPTTLTAIRSDAMAHSHGAVAPTTELNGVGTRVKSLDPLTELDRL